MPIAQWPLHHGRPAVQIVLTLAHGGGRTTRTILADSGAGSVVAPFELLLEESDCVICDGIFIQMVNLGGAFTGPHPLYLMRVEVPILQIDQEFHVVGVSSPPAHFDGIACFPFLNRFTYGNFGNPNQFALEA